MRLPKRSGAEGVAAFKLDMSKVYDNVDWHFLKRMMQKMGFEEVGGPDHGMLLFGTVPFQG